MNKALDSENARVCWWLRECVCVCVGVGVRACVRAGVRLEETADKILRFTNTFIIIISFL